MSECLLPPSLYPLFDKFFTLPSSEVIDEYGKDGFIQGYVLLYYTDCHMHASTKKFGTTALQQKYVLHCETNTNNKKSEDSDFMKFIVKDNEKIFDLFPATPRHKIGEGAITVSYRYGGANQNLYLEVTNHQNTIREERWVSNKIDSSVLDFIGILYSLQDSEEYERMHEDLD